MQVGKYACFALILSTAQVEVTNMKVMLSFSETLTTDRSDGKLFLWNTLHEISC